MAKAMKAATKAMARFSGGATSYGLIMRKGGKFRRGPKGKFRAKGQFPKLFKGKVPFAKPKSLPKPKPKAAPAMK